MKNIIDENNVQKRKKPSILDPYFNEIKYYYDLGISIASIRKIINERAPIRLSRNAYVHFIKNNL